VRNPHIGTDLDDYLRAEGRLEATEAAAAKRVIAWQISQEMKKRRMSKTRMAQLMHTSRPVLDRLLDPGNPSVTLFTLQRAASALGKRLRVDLM
jgi:antitoxin HicB